jgi:hypothetical protein
MKKARLAA